MPAKSKSQFRLLQALIHNRLNNSPKGLGAEKAKEFIESTKSYKQLPEKVKKK